MIQPRHIAGAEREAFAGALERVAMDFAEVLRLASLEPGSAVEWRATYQELTDAWFRMGSGLAEMVMAATGEDIRRFFERPESRP